MSEPKLEIVSDDLVWLEFAGKEIRIAHNEDGDESIRITVHNPEEDYHAQLYVRKDEVYP
jgi:hypothetical protein